jgi:hypothetical protein
MLCWQTRQPRGVVAVCREGTIRTATKRFRKQTECVQVVALRKIWRGVALRRLLERQ